MQRRDSEGDPERNIVVGKEETPVLTLIREAKELGMGENVWEFTSKIKCDGADGS